MAEDIKKEENIEEVEINLEANENQEVQEGEIKEETEETKENDNELENVKKELSDTKDKYLRMLAEYENYRKRTAKEKQSLYDDIKADTLSEILPVIDNLDRAYSSIKDIADEQVTKGIEMVIRQFKDILTKLGIEEVKSVGEEFNPLLHNAVMHIEDDSEDKNKVVEEFQKGYKIGDKVIRPSMVKVLN